jgi:hypothetical protein
MADTNGPYGIGTTTWPGLAKLIEECGETLQVLGKLVATGNLNHTWVCDLCRGSCTLTEPYERECHRCTGRGHLGAGDLTDALHDELGDLQGALNFFTTINDEIDTYRIIDRASEKFSTFCRWHYERLPS